MLVKDLCNNKVAFPIDAKAILAYNFNQNQDAWMKKFTAYTLNFDIVILLQLEYAHIYGTISQNQIRSLREAHSTQVGG